MKKRSAEIIIRYLLEKQEIYLPSAIFKNEMILELESAIKSRNPVVLSRFYKRVSENLEKYIEIEKIKKIVENILSYAKKFEEKGKLTEDDYKIINFLVENSFVEAEDSIELCGPLYNLLRVYEELEKEKIKSEYVKMFIMASTFIQLYELTLLLIDRRLYNYIKNKRRQSGNQNNELRKIAEKFLNGVDRKFTEHATAGKINTVLSKFIGISSENESILSGRLRELRNKLSHANFFYDAESDAVFAGKAKLTKEEFIEEFYRLFNFVLTWFKLSAKTSNYQDAFDSFIGSLKNTLLNLSKIFLRVERSHLRREFGSLVIEWKKGLQN
ncbi:MAG: hypothetical protein PWR13_1091 [Archaeoglobi archaeon]|nr:hypothetical protein [Archaeoglobi archaeon]